MTVLQDFRVPSKHDLYGDPATKPRPIRFDPAGIPNELRAETRWVLWRFVWKDSTSQKPGAWTKVPARADGTFAKSNDAASWTTFESAVAALGRSPDLFAGAGFVLGGGWVGLDLDGVRDPATDQVRPWAAEIVTGCGTFADVSPSGSGLKLIGRGVWAGSGKHWPHPEGGDAQVHRAQFYALTGSSTPGSGPIRDVTAALAGAFGWPPFATPRQQPPHPRQGPDPDSDDDLIRRAGGAANGAKFRALWAGDTGSHAGDDSAADFALCGILAFWCGPDPARIDRLFRRSGLMRAKWDEPRGNDTYGAVTIANVLRGRTEYAKSRAATSPPPATAADAPDPWGGPPAPLPTLPPVRPFPVGVLPARVADYFYAAAESLNVPVDYVAVPGLTLLGAAVGRSRAASLKDGYSEVPALWSVVIAPPGSTKSAALKSANAPLWDAERKWRKSHADAMQVFDLESERYARLLKEWHKNGCGGEPPAKPRKPGLRQSVLDGFTGEALVKALAANPRGMAVCKDELSGFVNALNMYRGGRGDDRERLLGCWAGATVKANRVLDGDAPPLLVPHPFLAVCGMLCPEVLPALRGEDRRGGEAPADGFIDRFLMSYPDPLPAVGETWRTVPEALTAGYCEVFLDLLGFDLVSETKDGAPSHRPLFVSLDASGRAEWEAFTLAVARRMNALDESDPFRGVLSKLRGYCLRLAALLWCLRRACHELPPDSKIDDSIVRAAGELVDYFELHARRCLGVGVTDRTGRVARRLVRWLADNPARLGFTRSEAFQQLKDRRDVTRGEHLDAPLSFLVDHGHLRVVAGEVGGRPGPVPQTFSVNPHWERGAVSGDLGERSRQVTHDAQ